MYLSEAQRLTVLLPFLIEQKNWNNVAWKQKWYTENSIPAGISTVTFYLSVHLTTVAKRQFSQKVFCSVLSASEDNYAVLIWLMSCYMEYIVHVCMGIQTRKCFVTIGWALNNASFICLDRFAKYLTSHVTGKNPWLCLAAQTSSGTSRTASDGMRRTSRMRPGGMRGSATTTPCCTPCSSWPSCLGTCWCVWPCWESAHSRRPQTTWWLAWLWLICWWRHWSCLGPYTWRWVPGLVNVLQQTYWSICI